MRVKALYDSVFQAPEIPVRCRQIQYVLHLSTPHLRTWYDFFFSLCPWRLKSSLTEDGRGPLAPARPEPLYSSIVAVVLAVEILPVYSVLEMSHTAVARTPLMHVARTTSSVRSRYRSTRSIVSLICSVSSSWRSFGIPMRCSKQYTAGLIPMLCNRTHSE